LVRHFPLFAKLSVEDCERVVALAHESSYRRGKTIFFEGDPVQHVVVLVSGCVKLLQVGWEGHEVILRLAGPGESLSGECFPKFKHCSRAQAVKASNRFSLGSTSLRDSSRTVPGAGTKHLMRSVAEPQPVGSSVPGGLHGNGRTAPQ
jgi:hypothetical protein